jgi:hypothetical protein
VIVCPRRHISALVSFNGVDGTDTGNHANEPAQKARPEKQRRPEQDFSHSMLPVGVPQHPLQIVNHF